MTVDVAKVSLRLLRERRTDFILELLVERAKRRVFLNLGVDEYFQSQGVCFVEWADRVLCHLPVDHVSVEITAAGETTREFRFRATGAKSAAVIARLRI